MPRLRASRFLPWLAVPMVVLPILLVHPAEEPPPAHDDVVTMGHEEFGTGHLTIHVGDSVVMDNTSAWLHVIVPGEEAVTVAQQGLPQLGRHGAHLSQTGDEWTIGPFEHPGSYHLTCSLHPEMNLTVTVVA